MTLSTERNITSPETSAGKRDASRGLVSEIQKFCVHDGPGIRTLVFLKGCNLNCLWCQNPETISGRMELFYSDRLCIHCGDCIEACPEGAILSSPAVPTIDPDRCLRCFTCTQACPTRALRTAGEWMDAEEVMDAVESDRSFYDNSGGGVTFSGGEPTVQYDFLMTLLQEAGRRGIHRVIETNGRVEWKKLARLLPHVEMILFDVKHMDSRIHKRITGAGNRLIQSNLERLSKQQEVKWLARFPLVPTMNDDEGNLDQMGRRLVHLGAREIHVLPYHRLGQAKAQSLVNQAEKQTQFQVPPDEDVEKAASILRKRGLAVTIGG